MAFSEVVQARRMVQTVLEANDIDASYEISITDAGPRLTIYVPSRDVAVVREALKQPLLNLPAVTVAPHS